MDIAAALDRAHSKALSARIARSIGNDRERFGELMTVLLDGPPRLAQRAAWPMGLVCEAHPELAIPWLPRLLDRLEAPAHDAVHRNILRTLQFCALPEPLHGRLTDLLFRWVADPQRAIASRAYAITAAMRLVQLYPELGPELRTILELVLREDAPPALRSRGNKALTRLRNTFR